MTVGRAGGVITAGPHSLVIPPGALERPTTITMTAPTGLGVNAVKFAPEGLEFDRPAILTMSYANCSLVGRLLPKHIAYTTDDLDILYYIHDLDVFNAVLTKRVSGRIYHFSDYVVAW